MVSQISLASSGVLAIPFAGEASASERPRSPAAAFVAGPENRCLAAAVLMLLNGERTTPADQVAWCSPLVLYGPSGVGKSHLIAALAAEVRRRAAVDDAGQEVIVVTATDFARQYADAIETQSTAELTGRWRAARLLAIDDIHELVHRPEAQLELARTFDALEQSGGQAIVSARALPGDLELLPALTGRLLAGLVIQIAPPAHAAREQLVAHFARRQGLALSEESIARLAAGVIGNSRDIYAATTRLALLHGPREPSRSPRRNRLEAADIDQVIAEFNQQSEPSLEAIARAAARHFGLPTSQVRGLSRQRHVALARAVSMYLARELTSQSLQCIGRFFSGRDHTTVLHAWRKIGQQVATDPRLRAAVESIDNVCKPTGRFASDATARSTLTIRARRRKAEH